MLAAAAAVLVPPATAEPAPLPAKPILDRACGFRRQYIFPVSEHDMTIVVTAGARSYDEEQVPQDFLYSDIVRAAHPASAKSE